VTIELMQTSIVMMLLRGEIPAGANDQSSAIEADLLIGFRFPL
jgi:hypothetical protein